MSTDYPKGLSNTATLLYRFTDAHSKLKRFPVTQGNPVIADLKAKLERSAVIEPASSAWKAKVIAIIR